MVIARAIPHTGDKRRLSLRQSTNDLQGFTSELPFLYTGLLIGSYWQPKRDGAGRPTYM